MTHLVDILNRKADEDKPEELDTKVEIILDILSEGIDCCVPNDGSNLSTYSRGIHLFMDGLQAGLQEASADVFSSPYNCGYSLGENERKKYRIASSSDVESPSPPIDIKLLIKTLHKLDKEIEALIRAYKNPYEFLLAHIKTNNRGSEDTTMILLDLLSSHRDLTDKLLAGTLDESDAEFKNNLRIPKEYTPILYVREGIIHLFRGELYVATYKFYQPGLNVFNIFGSKIHLAYTIFESAYSQIQFARQFEISGN